MCAGASSSTGQAEPAQAGCSSFSVPGSYALAHRIITGWLSSRQQGLGCRWREVPVSQPGCCCAWHKMLGPARLHLSVLLGSLRVHGTPVGTCAQDRRPCCVGAQDVAGVEVDEDGTFKYMLLRLQCSSGSPGRNRLLVRGSTRAGYHRDVLARCRELDAHDGSQVRCAAHMHAATHRALCTLPAGPSVAPAAPPCRRGRGVVHWGLEHRAQQPETPQ